MLHWLSFERAADYKQVLYIACVRGKRWVYFVYVSTLVLDVPSYSVNVKQSSSLFEAVTLMWFNFIDLVLHFVLLLGRYVS